MAIITRKLEWDSGHRVLGHEGKCAALHGHRYVAEITIESPQLDSLGRVVDFGVIKGLIGGWINENWDHNMLLHKDDPLVGIASLPLHTYSGGRYNWDTLFAGKEPYIMQLGNPTAENIAAELLMKATEILKDAGADELRVSNVRIYETPNCAADCTPSILQMMVDARTSRNNSTSPIPKDLMYDLTTPTGDPIG